MLPRHSIIREAPHEVEGHPWISSHPKISEMGTYLSCHTNLYQRYERHVKVNDDELVIMSILFVAYKVTKNENMYNNS